jgi:hypothetical protein
VAEEEAEVVDVAHQQHQHNQQYFQKRMVQGEESMQRKYLTNLD